MNFPRVRSILWDATPDNGGKDAAVIDMETFFTISTEQLISSELVWKADAVEQLREKLRQRKQNPLFVTIRETWCETGNCRVFARRLIFEAVYDTMQKKSSQQEACIPLLVDDSDLTFSDQMTNHLREPLFRGFWLRDLFKCSCTKLVIEENGEEIILRVQIPDVQFVFTKITSPRIHNMEFICEYAEHFEQKNPKREFASPIDNFGFLSMNSVRKLILYEQDDPDILERQPVVGIWLVVKDRLDPAMLWMACYNFLFMQGIYERVLQNGSFLVLLFSDRRQKYSVLCCNCEAKFGRENVVQKVDKNPKPSQKTYSCYFTVPEHGNSDITGYLGLPVKIYRLSTTTLDQRKVTYSLFGTKATESNSQHHDSLPEWKYSMSTKTSKEDIVEERRRESFTKPSTSVSVGADGQLKDKNYHEEQEKTTKQQLERLQEEMNSLKKYFCRLGVSSEYEENNKQKVKTMSGEAKFWNHKRRPRSPSQEDISEDTVFPKIEGNTGHIMSPVSSATDGDPKNELFQHPKTMIIPPMYARQPNNSWSSKPRVKNRIDVAVQVDYSRSNDRSSSQEQNASRTNHSEVQSGGVEELFDKVDEQVVTDDLKSLEYSHRQLETSVKQNNSLSKHKCSSHSSSCSSPSYKNFGGDTKGYASSSVDMGDSLSCVRSQGSSHSYQLTEPTKTFVNSRKKRHSSNRRHLSKQRSSSPLVELEDESELTVPKIIYNGFSEDENFDYGYSSSGTEHCSR